MHAKGKDMIPGASPDSSDHVFITDVITKERLRPHLLADNSEALTSKVESKSLNSSQQHMGVRQLELTKGQVEGNEQNGLPVKSPLGRGFQGWSVGRGKGILKQLHTCWGKEEFRRLILKPKQTEVVRWGNVVDTLKAF